MKTARLSSRFVSLALLSWTGLLLAFSPNSSLSVVRFCSLDAHRGQLLTTHQPNHPPSTNNKTRRVSLALNSNRDHGEINQVTGITLKMAFDSSPSWGVAETSPTSERFTSPQSLDMVHRLRRVSSAVLVGRGTVSRDDCSLTVRRVEMEGRMQPVRVVLDPGLKLLEEGKQYALLNDGLQTIIYHTSDIQNDDMTKINEASINDAVTLVEMKSSPTSDNSDSNQQYTISPTEIIQDLSSRGLNHIMIEGGPTTARLFLDAKLVDRAILVRAPIQFKQPIPAGFNEEELKNAGLVMIGTEDMGGDTVEYWVRSGMEWPMEEFSMWP